MRKVIFSIMTSLDGFDASPDGGIDWHYADDEHTQYALQLFANADALLFGRVTYQLMAEYWPGAPVDPLAEKMNSIKKWVFSNTLQSAAWQGASIVDGDAATAVRRLKQQPGKDMLLFGSGQLAAALTVANLIDEYQIMVCPIAIGRGKSPFALLNAPHRLQLISASTRRSGVVDLHYRNAA